jgi:hypothetical protein
LRGFRVDGIAVGAQAHHSGGSPINQRECAGFNWPELSIPAQEPVSSSPEAVSRAGWSCAIASFTDADKSIVTLLPSGIRPVIETPGLYPLPPSPSLLVVVGQPARYACRGS